jgi:hypothetical protein
MTITQRVTEVAAMNSTIRFPTVGERSQRAEAERQGAPQQAHTHSGRVLCAKILGLPHAGMRQKDR